MTSQVTLSVICLALFAGISFAQMPGDGIPDVYVVVAGAETFDTSVGVITRPVGTVVVDTDGNGMEIIFIEGPDVVTVAPNNGNYLTGATTFLPDPNAPPPFFASNWTSGYISGLNQYVRTNPLNTEGFIGVVGKHDVDPFSIFPNLGLATENVLTGEETLIGGNVVFSTFSMGEFSTEDGTMGPVFPTPEPGTISLLGIALLGLLGLRRRS